MRDARFIAMHRGGPLDRDSHVFLARWAADCASRVLQFLTRCSDDPRPREALEIARAWANGEVKTGAAMKASVAAHAAARSVTDGAATAAARAAGQAVATAHAADHSMGAALYALKAIGAAGLAIETEWEWQLSQLRPDLLPMIVEGMELRMKAFTSTRSKRRRPVRREAG